MFIVNRVAVAVGVAVLSGAPVLAQRGTPPPRPRPGVDSAQKSGPPQGVSLDFQDQELRVVLDALAAAGDLNVVLANVPSQRVTLHMGRPVSRDAMAELLTSVAEAHGLKVTRGASLIQIVGPAPEPAGRNGALSLAQQLLQQQAQQPQLRLFTYRLKHASAVQLAPVLTNLFGGAGSTGPRGTTVIPNGNGGFTTITTGPPGNISSTPTINIPTPFGGGGRGGRGGGGNIAAQLSGAFAEISGALSNQSGDIRIIPEESSNSLLIRATTEDFALVQQVLGSVDLRPLQVLIEVTIAEVQRTHDLDVGVSGSVTHTAKGKAAADATATAPNASSARDFILALTGGHGTIDYNVAIAALQERGDVRVLSLPVIIAQNNRQAQLNVGSRRPFVQVSQTVPNDPTGRVQTVQYVDVGTVLTITPTINPDGYVNLQLSQTDNSATNEVQFDAPIINTREATTQIFIRDGQTTVIGGLAGKTHSNTVSGIPFLSRIPIIGPLLFGRTTRNEDTSELFVFLTPHIITSDDDIDKLREAVHEGSELLKDLPVGARINPRPDTLPITRIPRDSATKLDSLTTMRRRPPSDTLVRPWR